jgi:ATP-dependent exoDNAse (exonuclease V) alpha subunit
MRAWHPNSADMAIYHLSVKCMSRSRGQSATAAAAYRAAEKIRDDRTGEIHDYGRKGGVLHRELVVPQDSPAWAQHRERLWNAAEQSETRKNSTVAREFEIALPSELRASERARLAVDFARAISMKHRCAVDVSVHRPGRGGDTRNHHAHLLCTTRRLGREGFGEKTRELDDAKTGEVVYWRERWAALTNERLKERGIESRIDHRTLEAQGIDRVPTVHKGPLLTALERRGIEARVSKRLDQERTEDIQARLSRAAEFGRLEREGREVEQSILVLSTDIAAAKAERGREASRRGVARDANEAQKSVERWKEEYAQRSPPSLEELRRQGREAWLKLRQDSGVAPEQRRVREQTRERDADQGPDKEKEREPDNDLDLER